MGEVTKLWEWQVTKLWEATLPGQTTHSRLWTTGNCTSSRTAMLPPPSLGPLAFRQFPLFSLILFSNMNLYSNENKHFIKLVRYFTLFSSQATATVVAPCDGSIYECKSVAVYWKILFKIFFNFWFEFLTQAFNAATVWQAINSFVFTKWQNFF